MIDAATVSRMEIDNRKTQEFNRAKFDELVRDFEPGANVWPSLWDLAFQAGNSHGALSVARAVYQGWVQASANVSKQRGTP